MTDLKQTSAIPQPVRPVTLPEILNIPPKLYPIIFDLNKYELFLLEGGRGSAKSHSVARLLLYLGEQKKLRIVCGREIQANIEESVYSLMKDLIEEFDLAYDVFAFKIKHKLTGTEINFKGFREQGNVSVKGLEGVDILWIDEAQSITKPTLDIIMPTMRKETVKVIFTMNRFLREDAVPEYAIGRPETLHIQINYFENPFCPQILKKQAEEMKVRSMRDYKHVWLGEPLQQADDYLFNFDKLHGAFEVDIFGDMPMMRQRVMAFDFAAQGNDLCVGTVLDRMSNIHWKPTETIPWDESDTMVSVGRIINYIGQFKPDVSCIDIGGMGKPVYDRLVEAGINIIPFDGGSNQGIDKKAYANNRAFGYYTVKDWLDAGFLSLDRDKDRELVKELEKIKMKYRSNGCRVIQAKTDMKKELGYSPDHADSLMMAVWCATQHLGTESNTYNAGLSNSAQKITRVTNRTRHRRKK